MAFQLFNSWMFFQKHSTIDIYIIIVLTPDFLVSIKTSVNRHTHHSVTFSPEWCGIWKLVSVMNEAEILFIDRWNKHNCKYRILNACLYFKNIFLTIANVKHCRMSYICILPMIPRIHSRLHRNQYTLISFILDVT